MIRSVANNTRRDGEDFLKIAAEIPIRTEVRTFPLERANRALNALKNDAVRGAAVLEVRDERRKTRKRRKRVSLNCAIKKIARIRLTPL